MELVHNHAVVDQGHGRVHHAVHPCAQGRGEDLLRGHVGDVGYAGLGDGAAPRPDGPLRRRLDRKSVV